MSLRAYEYLILIDKMTDWGNRRKAVLFSHLRKTIPVNLVMNEQRIDIVPNFRYLGITFDSKLSWGAHIKLLRRPLGG